MRWLLGGLVVALLLAAWPLYVTLKPETRDECLAKYVIRARMKMAASVLLNVCNAEHNGTELTARDRRRHRCYKTNLARATTRLGAQIAMGVCGRVE